MVQGLSAGAGARPGPGPWRGRDVRSRRVFGLILGRQPAGLPRPGDRSARDRGRLTLPIQQWRAADDEILVDPFHASAVRAALPSTTDYHVVAKARHFDFLTPCDDYTRKNIPSLCDSDPGFDRAAFHADFNRAVVGFFAANLPARP